MKAKKIISIILLFLTAAIWGFALVAQTNGMDYIGPYTFTAVRSMVGGVAMLLMRPLFSKLNINEGLIIDNKTTIRASIFCGIFLFLSLNLQQYALLYTTAGKAGFITTMYIVIIPIMRYFAGVKIDSKTALCIIVAIVGLYFITIKENFSINIGDLMLFIAAITMSTHTLLLSKYAIHVDIIKLNGYQFLIVSLLSFIPAIIFEHIELVYIEQSLGAILYVGILSSAVGYFFQIVGVKNMDPTVASLILSLESVFSVLGGYLFLNQILTRREIFGCCITALAILMSQLPSLGRKQKE
jgi:drug/metabolite transporter (DMT)-like permease